MDGDVPKDLVLCSIAARGGSKGIPDKNLRLLAGKPLIAHAVLNAIHATHIDRVIVSTDSEEIAETAASYGAEIPFLRPPSLAEDSTPLIHVTQHTMLGMDKHNSVAEIVVQLTPTCPFITPRLIDHSIELITELRCDSTVSLQRIEHSHPYRARILHSDKTFDNFIKDIDVEAIHSRQDLPELFCTSGGLYTRRRRLLENYDGSDFALGQKRVGIPLDDIASVNIDRMIDLQFAEFLIAGGYARDHVVN